MPAALKMRQIIALRFAPDEEFVPLAEHAVKENMSSADIKKAIVHWDGQRGIFEILEVTLIPK